MYGLYTEGVRQGGMNRSRGEPFFPNNYDSDLMKNYEVGYRSSFADGKGRLNLSRLPHGVGGVPASDARSILRELSRRKRRGDPHERRFRYLMFAVSHGRRSSPTWVRRSITGLNVTVDYAPNENWVLGFNYEKMEAETDSDHDLNDNVPIDYEIDCWNEVAAHPGLQSSGVGRV